MDYHASESLQEDSVLSKGLIINLSLMVLMLFTKHFCLVIKSLASIADFSQARSFMDIQTLQSCKKTQQTVEVNQVILKIKTIVTQLVFKILLLISDTQSVCELQLTYIFIYIPLFSNCVFKDLKQHFLPDPTRCYYLLKSA